LEFLSVLCGFYIIANLFHFVYVLESASRVWLNIEKNGLKIKHLINVSIFIPSYTVMFLIFVIFAYPFLWLLEKFSISFKDIMEKPVWKKKI